MNVRQLRKALEFCNGDAIVYIGNPNGVSDYQTAHELLGIRYAVNANEEVWFETYDGEDIKEEIEAIVEACLESNVSDEEFIDILFDNDKHGYTLEDIRKANESVYQFCMNNEYCKDMYFK